MPSRRTAAAPEVTALTTKGMKLLPVQPAYLPPPVVTPVLGRPLSPGSLRTTTPPPSMVLIARTPMGRDGLIPGINSSRTARPSHWNTGYDQRIAWPIPLLLALV